MQAQLAFPGPMNIGSTHATHVPVHMLQACDQKHLRCTIVGPDSSYSCLEIHICWNVLSEDKIDPPIHTEYLRSGGATTLIFMVDGAKAVNSLVILSPMPANMVVPPLSTTLAYRSFLMSTSHFMMGWKRTSGHLKRSLPTVMMFPSGNSYVFSLSDDSPASFISVSKSNAMYETFPSHPLQFHALCGC